MRIDPSDATPMKATGPHEGDDLVMGQDWSSMEQLVVDQECSAAPVVADQQLTVDEVVGADLVPA